MDIIVGLIFIAVGAFMFKKPADFDIAKKKGNPLKRVKYIKFSGIICVLMGAFYIVWKIIGG